MKRIILLTLSFALLSALAASAQDRESRLDDDAVKSFITRMYNESLYEDYGFLQEHCSPALLKKLEDAYTYDTDSKAYATWLFRSGQHDSAQGATERIILDITVSGDWYTYTALDMGHKFTNSIKIVCKEGKPVIEDIIRGGTGAVICTEIKPEFDGRDMNHFSKWVKENYRYPLMARLMKIKGMVTVEFRITEEGKLTGAKVIRGAHKLLDKEALRIINSAPDRWKPATSCGKPVEMTYRINIFFPKQENRN